MTRKDSKCNIEFLIKIIDNIICFCCPLFSPSLQISYIYTIKRATLFNKGPFKREEFNRLANFRMRMKAVCAYADLFGINSCLAIENKQSITSHILRINTFALEFCNTISYSQCPWEQTFLPQIQVGPLLFHVPHYLNQSPIKKITTLTYQGNKKMVAWVGSTGSTGWMQMNSRYT